MTALGAGIIILVMNFIIKNYFLLVRHVGFTGVYLLTAACRLSAFLRGAVEIKRYNKTRNGKIPGLVRYIRPWAV